MTEVKVFRLLLWTVGQAAPQNTNYNNAIGYDRFADAVAHGASADRTKFDPYIEAEGLVFEPAHVRAIHRYMER